MLDRHPEQAAALLSATVPRFKHHAGVVLLAVDGLACGSATLQLAGESFDQRPELRLIVERNDDLVTAFVTLRVVRIPAHDIALNVVVVWVNGAHDDQCAPADLHPTVNTPRPRSGTCTVLVTGQGQTCWSRPERSLTSPVVTPWGSRSHIRFPRDVRSRLSRFNGVGVRYREALSTRPPDGKVWPPG